MSFIDITTNNMSRQLRNANTYLDNWVYVPGPAITGEWKKPVALRSLDEFQKTFGTQGQDGTLTYEYASGILSAGLPVLFRRIAYVNQENVTDDLIEQFEEGKLPASVSAPVGVRRAKYYSTTSADEETDGTKQFKIVEKYGGSFGNNISVSLSKEDNDTQYFIEIYVGEALNQRVKICTIPSSVFDPVTKVIDPVKRNEIIIAGLTKLKLNLVDVKVYETNPVNFVFTPVGKKALSGGVDIDDKLIQNEIVNSLDFIEDKILYQPKFVTSGGFTDDNITISTDKAIGKKLLAFTKKRQDCRALIDLPIGILPKDQQGFAQNYVYQQNSDAEPIPSGSVCAPWQYMQVGNEQLWMPPSYAYLTVVGSDLSKGRRAYTPKAGIYSGRVANIIRPEFEIGSTLSEKWQTDGTANINPIMKLQSGSYVIAGNSTLLQTSTDGNEINAFAESSADLTIIEIRRFVYNLATELQYQYNGTTAFETFSLRTAKFLNTMASEGAVTDYNIINVSTDDDPRTLKVQLDVYLTPTIKKIEIYLNVAYGSIEVSTGGVR